MIEQTVFYFFAGLLLLAATMVITVKNPVHAALSLVLAFFCSAAIWLLLQAEFLAIVLILVYVGAVMVLFLFVIMMLDINLTVLREGFSRFLPVGISVAVLMAVSMGLVITSGRFTTGGNYEALKHAADYSNTRELGIALFTDYLYPFEIAGAILLLAIVAAISLTLRKRPDTKTPKVEKQVAVHRAGHVRLVRMEAEKE
ncbi:MAG: NADH:ubiquinone oxidoreductase, subunit J [Gammaproteobacteria bacterium]|nr:NADH:ubiquinone oxidoreductase, subunit J [Gammaproteobacteria bacterium]